MPRATATAMLGLVLVLALLTACGGGGDPVAAEDETQIAGADRSAGAGLAGLGDASVDELREQVGRAAAAIRRQADSLEDVDAPALLEAAAEQLADTLRTVAGELEQQAESLDAADVERVLEAVDGLDASDLWGLLERLRTAGLDLPALAAP